MKTLKTTLILFFLSFSSFAGETETPYAAFFAKTSFLMEQCHRRGDAFHDYSLSIRLENKKLTPSLMQLYRGILKEPSIEVISHRFQEEPAAEVIQFKMAQDANLFFFEYQVAKFHEVAEALGIRLNCLVDKGSVREGN